MEILLFLLGKWQQRVHLAHRSNVKILYTPFYPAIKPKIHELFYGMNL